MTQFLALDTETHLFGMGNMAPRIVCLTYADDNGSGILLHDEIESWLQTQLIRAIEGEIVLVGCNMAYDMVCLLANFPESSTLIWSAYAANGITCIAIREQLLDIFSGKFNTKKYSLAEITRVRTGITVEKEDTYRLRYKELDGVPLTQWPEEAIEYAVFDAIYTYQDAVIQEARTEEKGYSLPTQFDDSRAAFCLRLMTTWGIQIDNKTVDQLTDELTAKLDELSVGLVRDKILILGKGKNKGKLSKKMVTIKDLIVKTYIGESIPTTPKGAIQTGAEVIEMCTAPELEGLAEYNTVQKVLSTYLSHMNVPTVHADFRAIGGATDRTSSSKPNIQNQPKKFGVRECFVARPGKVLLLCDYDSQESRCLAQSVLKIVGWSSLAERYKADPHFDPHLEFGAALAGITVAEAKRLMEAGDEGMANFRQRAKVGNFGYPGGMGPATMVVNAKSWGIVMSLTQAEELKEMWLRQWPEMKVYLYSFISALVQSGKGTVVHPSNGFVRAGCTFCQAANTYFQSMGAFITKRALWMSCVEAYEIESSPLYGARPILFVHDELGFEVTEERAAAAAKRLEEIMIEAMEYYTPDIPAAASAALMRRWSKKAKPVYRDGTLIPWEDKEI